MRPMLWAAILLVHPQVTAAEPVELLRDTRFENGIRFATRTNYPPDRVALARARWEAALPETLRSPWEFIEIAETQCFGENPACPQIDGESITYASLDGGKRCEVDRERGALLLAMDTEREWRRGCNLAAPQDGVEPRFCRGKAWNWPHLLVSQRVRDPQRPEAPLGLSGLRRLSLQCTAELTATAIGEPNPCPPGAWGDAEIANHCLLYLALVLVDLEPAADAPRPRTIYALRPLYASWDGATHRDPGAWLGLDPAGDAVYWTPCPDGLTVGRPVKVTVDGLALAAEACLAIQRRNGQPLDPRAYAVDELLVGWEIWGPFRCAARLGALSLLVER